MDILIPKLFHLGSEGSIAKVFSARLSIFKLLADSALYIKQLTFFAHTALKAQLFDETFERHSSPWVLSTSA